MMNDLFRLPDNLPVPIDDGGAQHLWNSRLPEIELVATDGAKINLSRLPGTLVLFCYPRTGRPGEPSLVENWDQIPGARGCTPQTCGYRDFYSELREAGIQHVFGLSTQTPEYQREAAGREERQPAPILSDSETYTGIGVTHLGRLLSPVPGSLESYADFLKYRRVVDRRRQHVVFALGDLAHRAAQDLARAGLG